MTDEADGGATPQGQHGEGDPRAKSDSLACDESTKEAAKPKMSEVLDAMNQHAASDRTPQRNEPAVEKTKLDTDACRDGFTRATAEHELKLQKQLENRVAVRPPSVPQEVVENYAAASACDSLWEKMTGTDRFRICGECKTNVYDFSSMELADIDKLVFQREGRQCNFFFKRKDGRYMVSDCPIAVKRRATIAIAAAVVGLLVLGAIGIACLTPQTSQTGAPVSTVTGGAPPASTTDGTTNQGAQPAPPR